MMVPKGPICDPGGEERFNTFKDDDDISYTWWEILCFPFVLCARIKDCHLWWEVCCFPYFTCVQLWGSCISLCSCQNSQCLFFWMLIQWVSCKIRNLTTLDPIFYPYYFYIYGQVIFLTILFVMLWILYGKSVVIPFFTTVYSTLIGGDLNSTAKRLRSKSKKYCFKKEEIFNSPSVSQSVVQENSLVLNIIFPLVNMFMFDLLNH